MSATQERVSARARGLWAGLAIAVIALFGFGLLANPATATDGNTGSVDTSVTSSYSERGGERTKGGDDDRCKPGDVCKKIDWCDGKDKPGNKPYGKLALAADDAPMVFTKGGGHDEPKCIERPKIEYKCCVVTDKGINQTVTVTNRAKYPFKVKVQLGNGEPIVEWVGAGKTATFTFKDVKNGEHKLVASVWAGGKNWCVFKAKTITVKCLKPTTPPTKPSEEPSEEPSTPPTSSSPEPSEEPTTPAPGGGGGDNEPQLPVTGASVPMIAGIGTALIALGAIAFVATRRRRGDATFTA